MCVLLCSLCQRLRNIPAAQSEAHALYGLDPLTLAQLSLKDAERAVSLQPRWPKALLQKVVESTPLGKPTCINQS